MAEVRVIFHLLCFAVWIGEYLGFVDTKKNIFDILAETIDAEIVEVYDLIQKNVEFETFDSKNLEQVFSSKPELFAGVPVEIIVSGLAVNDVDPIVYAEFSASRTRSPVPSIAADAKSPPSTIDPQTDLTSAVHVDDAPVSESSEPFAVVGDQTDDGRRKTLANSSPSSLSADPTTEAVPMASTAG